MWILEVETASPNDTEIEVKLKSCFVPRQEIPKTPPMDPIPYNIHITHIQPNPPIIDPISMEEDRVPKMILRKMIETDVRQTLIGINYPFFKEAQN